MSNVFKASNSNHVRTRELFIRDLQTSSVNDASEVNQTLLQSRNMLAQEQLLQQEKAALIEEKQLIDQLKQQAIYDIEQMKQEWATEKLSLEQTAYEEGFQTGFTEGRNKALADMEAALQQANEITMKSEKMAADYQESQERVILEIAMQAANRILNNTLEDDPERFLAVVRRAILEVREMKEVKLYISQKHYAFVADNRSELAAILPPDTPFLIFVNEEFDEDECYIETNHGRIVVTVDEQLEEIRRKLTALLEQGD